MTPNPDRDVWLVYDGECPICHACCIRARIQESVGRLHLVDARVFREDPAQALAEGAVATEHEHLHARAFAFFAPSRLSGPPTGQNVASIECNVASRLRSARL